MARRENLSTQCLPVHSDTIFIIEINHRPTGAIIIIAVCIGTLLLRTVAIRNEATAQADLTGNRLTAGRIGRRGIPIVGIAFDQIFKIINPE